MSAEPCVPFVRLEVSNVDDPQAGVALTAYVAGCPRRCPGCQNPDLQSARGRTFVPVSIVEEYVGRTLAKPGAEKLVEAIVFLGGDWMSYPEAYVAVATWSRGRGLRTVLYTGETYENLSEDVRQASDWVIDGPWDQDKAAVFPPSSNQRVFAQGRRVEAVEELPLYKHLLELRSKGNEQGGS